MKKLQLKIVSPEKIIYNGEVEFIQLPGTEGDFSLLPDHAPIVASLTKGNIVYDTVRGGSESIKVSIQGGFIEVNKNIVTICVE